jgi:cyclophilin family peptidyl-prolyl cis-trans isomerase
MKVFFLFLAALLLAGCSSSEELLNEARTPPSLGQEKIPPSPNTKNDTSPITKKTMYQNPPAMSIDTKKQYSASVETSAGIIEVELFADKVPQTVNNFVFLARADFYAQTIFHRTISGFMIQGGDPTGTGMGGPGYQFADEPFTGEYTRGTLAMANAGPDTNGSQFFIMHKDTALPKNYVIFGRVTKGIEVVDAIATAPTKQGGENSSPEKPVVVEAVRVNEQ